MKTNYIEFKMADKMAEKIYKPFHLSAKNVFKNVVLYAFLQSC